MNQLLSGPFTIMDMDNLGGSDNEVKMTYFTLAEYLFNISAHGGPLKTYTERIVKDMC